MNATQLSMTDELALLEAQVSAGDATWKTRARIGRLTRERDRASLGSLVKAFDHFEFRDGVLFRVRLKTRAKLAEFRGAAAWATVQELDLGRNGVDGIELGEFLGACPALHTLRGLSAHLVHATPCPGVRTLQLQGPMLELPQLEARFPGLRSLEVESVSNAEAFWAHPFVQRLESVTLDSLTWSAGVLRLRCGAHLHAFAKWIMWGPPLRRVELSEEVLDHEGALSRLYDALAAARLKGAEVVLVPGADEEMVRWSGGPYD